MKTTKLNSLLMSVRNAYTAHIELHVGLGETLAAMPATERKMFVRKAADAVAEITSERTGESITAYDGQRGIAFGVWVGKPGGKAGEGSYERTPAANAARMWFARNIVAYFEPKAAKADKADSKIWESIVADLTAARKVAKGLTPAMQRQFEKELAALVAEYDGE